MEKEKRYLIVELNPALDDLPPAARNNRYLHPSRPRNAPNSARPNEEKKRTALADHNQRRRLICTIYADGSRLDPRALAGFNERSLGRKRRTSIPPRRLRFTRTVGLKIPSPSTVHLRACDRMRLSSIGRVINEGGMWLKVGEQLTKTIDCGVQTNCLW